MPRELSPGVSLRASRSEVQGQRPDGSPGAKRRKLWGVQYIADIKMMYFSFSKHWMPHNVLKRLQIPKSDIYVTSVITVLLRLTNSQGFLRIWHNNVTQIVQQGAKMERLVLMIGTT